MTTIYSIVKFEEYQSIYNLNGTFYSNEIEKANKLQIEEISILQHYFDEIYLDDSHLKPIFKEKIQKKLIEYYTEVIKKLEDLIYKNKIGIAKLEQLIENSKTIIYTKKTYKKLMKTLNIILKDYSVPNYNSYDANKYTVKYFFFDIMKSWSISIRTDIFKNIAAKLAEKIKHELDIIDIDRKKIILPILYNLFSKNHYVLQSFNNYTFHNIIDFIVQFTNIINCEMSNLEIKTRYFEIDYDIFDINDINKITNINDNIKYYCDSFCNIIGNDSYEYNIKTIRFSENYKDIFGKDILYEIQSDIIKYYCNSYTIIESLKDIDDLKIYFNNHLKTIYGINNHDASAMFSKIPGTNTEVPKTALTAIKIKDIDCTYTGNLFDDKEDHIITEFPVYTYYFGNCSGGFMRFRYDSNQYSIIASIGIARGIDKISIQDVLSSKDFDIEINPFVSNYELIDILDRFISIIRSVFEKNNDKSKSFYHKINRIFKIMIELFGNIKNLTKHYYVNTNNPDIGISGYDGKFCMIYDFSKSDSIIKFDYSL